MAITIIGTSNWRGQKHSFGIKSTDRRQQVYVIGKTKTGMGKTTLLENMIVQDFEQGRGVAVLDPHGDLAQRLLRFTPGAGSTTSSTSNHNAWRDRLR